MKMGGTGEMGRHGEDGLYANAYVGGQGPTENDTEEARETILECGM